MAKIKLTNSARHLTMILAAISRKEGIAGRGEVITRGARHLSIGVRLANPLQMDKALGLAQPLALASSTKVVIAQREGGLIVYQFELEPARWETYHRGIDVKGMGVGLADQRQQIDFTFDEPHALIAGMSGSGKTEAGKSILTGLLTEYTPDELQLLIIDPHADYREDFNNVSHLIRPIACNDRDIDSVLAVGKSEFRRRKENHIKDAPRLVIVIDEAENTIDKTQMDRLRIARSIAAEARKFRVNLIVLTQEPSEDIMPKLMGKLGNRWIGKVDNAQRSAKLSGRKGLNCHELTGKGDIVRVNSLGVDRLLVALTSKEELDKIPRGEVQIIDPPEDTEPIIEEIEPEPEKKVGRKPHPVTAALETELPEQLAHYLVYKNLTQKQAEKLLGIKYHTHRQFKTFGQRVTIEANRLWRSQQTSKG